MDEPIVFLIDDDDAIRDSLTFLLSSHNVRARAYSSGGQFIREVGGAQARNGAIVTDLRMPDMSGLQLVRKLKELGVDAPVIVITGHGDVPLAVEAMRAGVMDFIEKPFSDETFLAAVRAAFARLKSRSKEDADRAVVRAHIQTLSGREREVMNALVAGHANKVIADDLGISARTVEIYRANVMAKMKAASLSELVRLALTSGLF